MVDSQLNHLKVADGVMHPRCNYPAFSGGVTRTAWRGAKPAYHYAPLVGRKVVLHRFRHRPFCHGEILLHVDITGTLPPVLYRHPQRRFSFSAAPRLPLRRAPNRAMMTQPNLFHAIKLKVLLPLLMQPSNCFKWPILPMVPGSRPYRVGHQID